MRFREMILGKYKKSIVLLLIIILLGTIIIAGSLGSAKISFSNIIKIIFAPITPAGIQNERLKETSRIIIWKIRLPRIILTVIAGMGLGVSGAVFQGIFRNPMANPYILGISSGAAFGVTLGMTMGLQITFLGIGAIPISAFIGAISASVVVYLISGGGRDILPLLLSGIAMGFLLSAMMSLLMYFNRSQLENIIYWTMGSFNAANWQKVGITAPVILPGSIFIILFSRDLNLIVLGEDSASSLGISVKKSRLTFLLISTIITASAVAVSGVIGFVGLIVPHAMRIITGPDHRTLIPYSMLGGAILLLISDTIARTIMAPTEIPVGIVTSLLGAPFFLFLLNRMRNPK
ncbi:MAG: iron ABC transporter permease [Spirochaetia bacterium]|jgi:iron complex transport system permease protein|nr:iron ABC transporter permease [Spirochaetia bacterium]